MSEPPESLLPLTPPATAPVVPTPRRPVRTDPAPRIGTTDGELLGVFVRRGGDDTEGRVALDRLVDRHAAMVWRVCRQALRRPADAEDAFQATFLILARNARSIRSSDSAAGWLYRVAHRTAVAARKKAKLRKEEPLDTEPPAPAEEPFPDLVGRQSVTLLMDELNRLPEKYRTPLVLRYLEGQSRRAIADATDTTVAAVQGRLARGKQLLRSRLVRRGVSLSVAMAVATGVASRAEAAPARLVATAATNCHALIHGGALAASVTALSLFQEGSRAMFIATMAKPAGVTAGVLMATLMAMAPTGLADGPSVPGAGGQLVIDASVVVANDVTTHPQPSAGPFVAAPPKAPAAPEPPVDAFVPGPLPAGMKFGDMGREGRKLSDAEQGEVIRKMWAERAAADPPPVSGEPSFKELHTRHTYWESRYGALRERSRALLMELDEQHGKHTPSERRKLESDVQMLGADAYLARAEALALERELKLRALAKDSKPARDPGALIAAPEADVSTLVNLLVNDPGGPKLKRPEAERLVRETGAAGLPISLGQAQRAVRSFAKARNNTALYPDTEPAQRDAKMFRSRAASAWGGGPVEPSVFRERKLAPEVLIDAMERGVRSMRERAERAKASGDEKAYRDAKEIADRNEDMLRRRREELVTQTEHVEAPAMQPPLSSPPPAVRQVDRAFQQIKVVTKQQLLQHKTQLLEAIAEIEQLSNQAVRGVPPESVQTNINELYEAVEKLESQIGDLIAHEAMAGRPGPSGPGYRSDPPANRPGGYGRYNGSVERLQQRLNEVLDPSPQLDVDGDYGPLTGKAVERFQREKGLPVNGFAEEATNRALGFVPSAPQPAAASSRRLRSRTPARPPAFTPGKRGAFQQVPVQDAVQVQSSPTWGSPYQPQALNSRPIAPTPPIPPTVPTAPLPPESQAQPAPVKVTNDRFSAMTETERLMNEIQELVHRSRGQVKVAERLAEQILVARRAEGAYDSPDGGPVTRAAWAALKKSFEHNRYLRDQVEVRTQRLIELSVGMREGDQTASSAERSAVVIGQLTSFGEQLQLTQQQIKRALAQVARAERQSAEPPGSQPLALGAKDGRVPELQRLLNERLDPSPGLEADGDFGPLTEQALHRFQRENGLTPNGVADEATWERLGGDSDEPAMPEAADDADEKVKADASALPEPAQDTPYARIIETSPARGAADVAPALAEVRVTFDRDMQGGMSWTGNAESGMPPSPEGQLARWVDKRTCVLPVQLSGGELYRLGINSKSHQNFKSADGKPAAHDVLTFATRGAKRSVARKARPPRVKEVSPTHGATGVDPSIKSIRVTFDSPMGEGMSWVKSAGGAFPGAEGKRAKWSRDGRTCTLPIDLRPGADYAASLNGPFFLNFTSKWGVPLEPVEWRFTTSEAADAGAAIAEPSPEEIAESKNRLKDLMLAMLNSESSNGRFPARAIYGDRERPLLSWRVALLPYLGEKALYDEFHHDEPWDSPHNEKLISRMPDAFRSPHAAAGSTRFLAVQGPRAFMPDRSLGRKVQEFVNGTSNTIALVESAPSHAVLWTQPGDYRPDENFTAPLGWPAGTAHDHFIVALVDGSIKSLPADELPSVLPSMLTIDNSAEQSRYGGGSDFGGEGRYGAGYGGGEMGDFSGGYGGFDGRENRRDDRGERRQQQGSRRER